MNRFWKGLIMTPMLVRIFSNKCWQVTLYLHISNSMLSESISALFAICKVERQVVSVKHVNKCRMTHHGRLDGRVLQGNVVSNRRWHPVLERPIAIRTTISYK